MERTYRIPLQNMQELQDKLAKLNRKASRLNCKPIELAIIATETEPAEDNEINVYNIVTVTGQAPKVNGWQFVGTLELTEHGNMIRNIPNHEIPIEYQTMPITCDHCNVNRYRKKSYLLVNEQGNYMQVGSTCLRDFTGHAEPHALALQAEWLAEVEEEMQQMQSMCGFTQSPYYDLADYLAIVAQVIEEKGWMGAMQAREWDRISTAEFAWEKMLNKTARPNSEHKALAETAIAWARNMDAIGSYLHNLKTIANNGYLSNRDKGFGASMIIAYQREQERLAKEQEQAEKAKTSKHFGVVGKRADYWLTVTKKISWDGIYGTSYLVILEDAEGNVATWKTANGYQLTEGEQVKLKATIKDHAEYEGVAQTELTRCKILESTEQQAGN